MKHNSYSKKRPDQIRNALVIFPFTYINPYQVIPPVAAEYLQAYLIDAGVNTTLLDMRFETDIGEQIENTDLICFYGHFEDCPIFGNWKRHLIPEIFSRIRPGTPVIGGGTGFGNSQQAFADYPELDIVIHGNPEMPVRLLLEQGTPEGIANIDYRNGDGIERNPREKEYHYLSETVYPRRDLRNPEYKYHVFGIGLDVLRAAVGCNYRCKFCYQFGKDFDGNPIRWRGRSAESLYNEIKTINAPFVGWVDDDMTADMENLSRLADLLLENNKHILFGGTGRLDHVLKSDVATLRKLEKAGFFALSFGVEALKPESLKLYGKGQTIEKIEKAMEMMQKTNTLLLCNFILGTPGETKEDMMDFLRFGRKWNVDTIITNRFQMTENSPIYRLVYDMESGKVRPGMERVVEDDLTEMKYKIKFGQRTPGRVLLLILKMYRQRGMFLDPLYIFLSAVETMIQHTWLEKTLIFPALLKLGRFFFSLPPVRAVSRLLAIIMTPPVRFLNWIFEGIDDFFGISTRLLPRLMLYFRDRVYRKQQAKAQKNLEKVYDYNASHINIPEPPPPVPRR